MRRIAGFGLSCVAGLLALTGLAGGQSAGLADGVPSTPLKQAYFGELHLHTSYSLDSFIFGNPNDPDTAYKFAQGMPVTLYGGETKQLRRPLDFVAITDHSEFLGEVALCSTPGTPVYDSAACKGIRGFDMMQFGKIAASVTDRKRRADICGADGAACVAAIRQTWEKVQANAARYYQPGKFTTLIGYEYSINIPGAVFSTTPNHDPRATVPGMLHRNVIFRTDHVPDTVFSAYDGTGEELQAWLETRCREPCRALTIPHNSNYSWGRFFWTGRNSDGTAWTRDILERRARIEPLVEIFQIKGSSECQAGIGLADEECDFENAVPPCPPGEADRCAGADSFVRDAVVKGLAVEETEGVNPFKYGFIAASDNHNGTPGATEENDFKGHLGQQDNTPEKRLGVKPGASNSGPGVDDGHGEGNGAYLKFNPGGLAGVWAEKNTREAIWDALARRETFGTSGTRIRVRFFGSFNFPANLHRSPDLVKIGYAEGVPMGGDLKAAPEGRSPTFVAWATRDPDSAPLQKIQVVKGWVDGGKSMVKVYDIVCSDGIQPDPKTGQCADNGATVDLATCKVGDGKGAPELAATWTDPAFDPSQRAVYYVRVLEDPVCRWSTYDAIRLKIAPPSAAPTTIKERAWTSPIWYTPVQRG
jgi:hypothetical protein